MNQYLHRSKFIGFPALLALLFFTYSCSHKIGFMPSTMVPAAQGNVKVSKDDNNNYKIAVSLVNLAPPERLQPPHSTYVVWIETAQNGMQNIGQINSSSGLLSKTLKASLNAVSPYKPTRLFITAEDNGAIQFPGSIRVLSTDSFN